MNEFQLAQRLAATLRTEGIERTPDDLITTVRGVIRFMDIVLGQHVDVEHYLETAIHCEETRRALSEVQVKTG